MPGCSRSAAWRMKMPSSHIWKPKECPFSICGILRTLKGHWRKRVLRWKAASRRSPRRRWQTGDGSAGQTFCDELSGPASCEICRWFQECDAEWRKQDHLSLVAGINRLQRKQLSAWEVTTVERLAALPLPIQNRPDHGSKEGYTKVREQARVQVAGRSSAEPVHEVFEVTGEHGLSLLPEPSSGDIFFDLEGDPFVGSGGREYLFGFACGGSNRPA